MIKVPYDLSYPEYFRVFSFLMLRQKQVRRLFLYLGGVGIFWAIIQMMSKKESHNFLTLILAVLMPFVFAFALVGIVTVVGSLLLYKYKPGYSRGSVYSFSHWGMERTGQRQEVSEPWRRILEVKETKLFFYLFVEVGEAYVVQKRMFDGSERVQEFRVLLEENVKEPNRVGR